MVPVDPPTTTNSPSFPTVMQVSSFSLGSLSVWDWVKSLKQFPIFFCCRISKSPSCFFVVAMKRCSPSRQISVIVPLLLSTKLLVSRVPLLSKILIYVSEAAMSLFSMNSNRPTFWLFILIQNICSFSSRLRETTLPSISPKFNILSSSFAAKQQIWFSWSQSCSSESSTFPTYLS